jgi:hypothetical protein
MIFFNIIFFLLANFLIIETDKWANFSFAGL